MPVQRTFGRSLVGLFVLVLSAKVVAQGPIGHPGQPPESSVVEQALPQTSLEVPPSHLVDQDIPVDSAVPIDSGIPATGFDIPLNARVQSFVNLLTGRLKGFLEEGLSRGTRFLPMIEEIFKAEGLPLDLVYVPLVESAFKPTALSRAKARGLWQFMPGTASDHGLKRDWYVDERSDAEKATRAAAVYLKTLAGMFDGDWYLALASYNAGPGRVQRAIKRSGRTDFWSLSASSRFLPRETRDYVPQILAAITIARNPAAYGITIEPPALPPAERVTVPGSLDLRRIAEWTDVPLELLQALNPELRRWTTPVRATDYELKVPDGSRDAVMAKLAESQPHALTAVEYHTVKKGETLQSLAKKLKVTRADLTEANYLSSKAKLSTGQTLIIPRAPVFLSASQLDALPALGEDADAPVDGVSRVALVRAVPLEPEAPVARVHRVKSGDTLFSIARRYGTDVASLREWNHLRGNLIKVGQRLDVVGNRTVATN